MMRDPNLFLRHALLPMLAVGGALIVLGLVIYWIRVWLRDSDGPAASDHDLLSEYRELHQRGELSDEEFRIIKSRFFPRIGQTAGSGPALSEKVVGPETRETPEQPGESVEKDCGPGNS